MSRTAVIYLDGEYITPDSKSLGRAPAPFFSVKMKPLGQLGVDTATRIYGDEMTFAQYSELGIVIGEYTGEIQFAEPQTGWSYVWDFSAGTFTVTDASAVSTQYTGRYTWESLAITWAVLQSHNFSVLISASFDKPVFLIGNRINTNRSIERNDFVWGQFEKYILDAMKWFFIRMNVAKDGIDDFGIKDAPAPHDYGNYSYDGVYNDYRTCLIALVIDLAAIGVYDQNMLLNEHNAAATRQVVEKAGNMADIQTTLMIHLFAAITLNGHAPYVEPWLLWQLFQWQGSGRAVSTRERIFDLSPLWNG